MAHLLMLGSFAGERSPATMLSRSHSVVAADLTLMGRRSFNNVAKSSDVLFLQGDITGGRLIADEVWHLLRNKPVVSLIQGLSLSNLREMYPLSKVARCRICSDGAAEKALFLFTVDRSYSDSDTSLLKGVAEPLGEHLLIPEGVLDRLSRQIDASRVVLGTVLETLKESMKGDRDLYGFVLDWVLSGMGPVGIGPRASEGDTTVTRANGAEALRTAVNQMLTLYASQNSEGA